MLLAVAVFHCEKVILFCVFERRRTFSSFPCNFPFSWSPLCSIGICSWELPIVPGPHWSFYSNKQLLHAFCNKTHTAHTHNFPHRNLLNYIDSKLNDRTICSYIISAWIIPSSYLFLPLYSFSILEFVKSLRFGAWEIFHAQRSIIWRRLHSWMNSITNAFFVLFYIHAWYKYESFKTNRLHWSRENDH